MKLDILALLLAALAGSIMAIQGTLNASLGKIVGLLEATLIVMIIGLVTAFVALFPLGLGHGNIFKFTGAPGILSWGILIVLITYAVAASIPKIGAANATTAIVAAQVTTALLIDHFGLFGLQAIPFRGGRRQDWCCWQLEPA